MYVHLSSTDGFISCTLSVTLKNLALPFIAIFICKIFEQLIAEYLHKYFINTKWLFPLQNGFRRGYSCETQLLAFITDVFDIVSKFIQCDCITIDFQKAFDMVPHDILIKKLRRMGIDRRLVNWIENFLTDRMQCVKIGDVLSEIKHVTSGVPQGSVLAPLLFLIFINDLPANILSKIRLFADDVLLYNGVNSQADQNILQSDLFDLEKWCQANKMKINVNKCNMISFGRKFAKIQANYKLNGILLPQVSNVKYLGVYFSSDLSWSYHVQRIIAKSNRSLYFIMRNLKGAPLYVKAQAYKSLIRPILEYCSSVWDPYHNYLINDLEMVQQKAARFVHNNFKSIAEVSKMVSNLKWPSLQKRRKINRLKHIFNICSGKEQFHELLGRLNKPSYVSRHDHMYKIAHIEFKTDSGRYSFLARSINDWNVLPKSIFKEIPMSCKSFINKISEIL